MKKFLRFFGSLLNQIHSNQNFFFFFDFADPQYEQELSSLIIIRDIIPFDSRTDLSSILYKQEVLVKSKVHLICFVFWI